MTKVKVCGLRRKEDIDYVNELKPDYVGFVFTKSKREVTLSEAEELVKHLNKDIKTVGVFVNKEIDKVREIATTLKLNVLQFHGDEDNEYMNNFKEFEVWKALGVSKKEDLMEIERYNTDGILLDSKIEGVTGGTGISFDWNMTADMNFKCKFILAGGLNSYNVQKAIKLVKPYAVDVSSGVETEGFKDFNKIKEFIDKVRETK